LRVVVGAVLSLALIGGGLFLLTNQGWITPYGLTPEGAGSFISGIFAPVALIWLIVGYFQQSEELRKNSDALRQQVEEMKSNGLLLKQQSELLIDQQKTLERRAFIEFLEPRQTALRLRTFNLLRAFGTREEIKERMDWYGAGYQDIFPNWLYNVVREDGVEQTLETIEAFFSSGRKLIEDYCIDYERLLLDADRHDINGDIRRNVEFSGVGTAYLGLARLLNRPAMFKYRASVTDELLATDNGWKKATTATPARVRRQARKPQNRGAAATQGQPRL